MFGRHTYIIFFLLFFFHITGSPSAKLGLRMTTLHEEHSGNALSDMDGVAEDEHVDHLVGKTPVKPQKLNLNNINTINQVRN